MSDSIQSLQSFLDASVSVYHAAAHLEQMLRAAGYCPLSEGDAWELIPGGKYYLTRGGTAVVAFRIPQETPTGFLLAAAHSDRPCFKIKEHFLLSGTYARMAVEGYGGMLMSTWLDRPLSVAGRVLVETEDGVESRLINLDEDLLLIPNVAIHMNRQANDGYKWNPAVDLLPLIGGKEAGEKLGGMISEAAGGRILGHDLYLYLRQKSRIWGVDGEYISSAALDDLECAWGCIRGLLAARDSAAIPVACIFDSEEVGSNSVQGAASMLLSDTLTRIAQGLGCHIHRLLSQSFLVSADNAHAVHPNHPEYADANNAPVPGGGVVLKFNAAQRYTTDGVSAAVFRSICNRAGVAVQTYCNRADMAGGSTLGHISLNHVSVPTADIGLAQLAMHSSYETAAVSDAKALEQAMTVYFGSQLTVKDGSIAIR